MFAALNEFEKNKMVISPHLFFFFFNWTNSVRFFSFSVRLVRDSAWITLAVGRCRHQRATVAFLSFSGLDFRPGPSFFHFSVRLRLRAFACVSSQCFIIFFLPLSLSLSLSLPLNNCCVVCGDDHPILLLFVLVKVTLRGTGQIIFVPCSHSHFSRERGKERANVGLAVSVTPARVVLRLVACCGSLPTLVVSSFAC